MVWYGVMRARTTAFARNGTRRGSAGTNQNTLYLRACALEQNKKAILRALDRVIHNRDIASKTKGWVKNEQCNCNDMHVILLTKHGEMRCNTRLRLGLSLWIRPLLRKILL